MTTLHDTAAPVYPAVSLPADAIPANASPAADKTAVHEAAVAEIVEMIRAKYTEDGLRSFAIGRRAYEHAVWQKNNFPGAYLNGDFNNLMARIRDDVRMYVPIKAESIRVADWTRCHVLREIVAKEASRDIADSLSMHEYLALVGKALHFTVADLEGDLNPCFLDMIKGVAADRANPDGRVTTEDFLNRIAATVKRAADAKLAALNPSKAAAKLASDKVKADSAAVAKSVKDITASIDAGIASGAIKPEGALAILEGVAKHHGTPLRAASIGFDPATASVTECEQAIDVMFSAGRIAEMKAMMARLEKRIATMEKAVGGAVVKAKAAKVSAEPVAVAA